MTDTKAIEAIREILGQFDDAKQHEIIGFIGSDIQNRMARAQKSGACLGYVGKQRAAAYLNPPIGEIGRQEGYSISSRKY